jgi:hypothetical protein
VECARPNCWSGSQFHDWRLSIDKLPERVKARVNELKNHASVAYSDITDEVDSILAAYAGTDLEVPSAQSEAYAKQAALRKKAKVEFRAIEPKTLPYDERD